MLFAHSWYIAGQGSGPSIQGENLGGWAVAGFFVLSGFLITRSRLRTSPGEYLLHRVARIYPAFVVVPLGHRFRLRPYRAADPAGIARRLFLTTPVTPFQYVWGNITLYIDHYSIGATLQSVPYPGAWNGSLWTLFYEFLCYMVIWVLGFLAVFRRSPVLIAAAWVLSVATYALIGGADTVGLDLSFSLFARLLPFFLGGSLMFFLVEAVGVGTAARNRLPRRCRRTDLAHSALGRAGAAPLLAYGLLSLSTWIPQPAWIARNDVSYGFYIYAWPVQQLWCILGGAASWACRSTSSSRS